MNKKLKLVGKRVSKPELLAPAGDWPDLISACAAGADSVYFGVKGLNMRDLAGNFNSSDLKKVMHYLHNAKKKGYLALNTILLESDLKIARAILVKAKQAKVDAVILWDLAALKLAKALKLTVHLSTQASVANHLALAEFARLGVKRIVLARECSLTQIKKINDYIRKYKLSCQLETFIHGAMCVSVSGRCFLSQYTFNKSANQGKCLQPCRRQYLIKDCQNQEAEYIVGKDYLLSPKDLCCLDFIEQLIQAKISAFKIEGRRRPPEYVRVVVSVYRRAIDAYFNQELTTKLKQSLKQELALVYNRGFSSGFYFSPSDQAISRSLEHKQRKEYLGQVIRFYPRQNVAEVIIHNQKLRQNDQLLFIGNNTAASFCLAESIQVDNQPVSIALRGMKVGIKLPFKVRPKDKVYLWVKRNFS